MGSQRQAKNHWKSEGDYKETVELRASPQRHGKYAELRVATELLKTGIPVYFPFVDDEKVDLIARVSDKGPTDHWDIQVKSSKGYNVIIGVPWRHIATKPPNYLLVIAYIHSNKPDEFFFLTVDDLLSLMPDPLTEWGEIRFNKAERERYRGRTMDNLTKFLLGEMGR